MRILLSLTSVFCLFLGISKVYAMESELKTWRIERENRLKAPAGWLSVVGLSWLKEGNNSMGSSFGKDVRLPESAPKDLGQITLRGGKAKVRFNSVEGVRLGDAKVQKNTDYDLGLDKADKKEGEPKIKLGSVEFFLIERKNGVGVRVKDSEAEARKNFKGCVWFDENPKYKITAKWVPLKPAKKLMIPDVIGNVNEEDSPGYAEFKLEGKTYKLYPTQEDDQLFYVFRDKTSGKQTYGSARFLYSNLADKNGEIILDFNKAYNPPCAFTDYATCPRAPEENILSATLLVGEKKPVK